MISMTALALLACTTEPPAPVDPTPVEEPAQPDPEPPTDPGTPEAPEAPEVAAKETCALASQAPTTDRCPEGTAGVACADALNDRGMKAWLKDKDLDTAVADFSASFALDRKASTGFNLCYALHQSSDLPCARWACAAALEAGPDDKLRQKLEIVVKDIDARQAAPPE